MNNNGGYIVSLEQIFARSMVRYEILDQLIPAAFADYNSTELNIFIDLYSIYRTLFSRGFHTNVKDYREFTVSTIDLCTHYRAYFRYIGVNTKIFLINSYNIPKNITYPNYNKTMHDKLKNKVVSDMVNINTELLRILCPYLYNIHFIDTDYESSVVMMELINREGTNPSLIISSDIYPIQLTYLFDNVAYLWPIKGKGTDESMIIFPKTHSQQKFTLWPVFRRKTSKISSEQIRGSLSARNLVLLESMTSVKERDITPTLLNMSQSCKLIYNCIGESDTLLVPDFLYEIPTFKDKDKIELIKQRYSVLNVEWQYEYYKGSIEQMKLSYQNLSDNRAVQLINDKYFSDNPIDILRL